jgi:hypothetical protein
MIGTKRNKLPAKGPIWVVLFPLEAVQIRGVEREKEKEEEDEEKKKRT